MYAIEFETKNDENFIKLPFNIPNEKQIDMKVTLLTSYNLENIEKNYSQKNLTTFKKGYKLKDFQRVDAYNATV